MTQNNPEEETLKFPSVVEAAEYIGITRQAFPRRTSPPPNAAIGKTLGWTKERLNECNANAPKPGKRAKKPDMEQQGVIDSILPHLVLHPTFATLYTEQQLTLTPILHIEQNL